MSVRQKAGSAKLEAMSEYYAVVGGPNGQAAAIRATIDSIRERAERFECDLPLSERSAWSTEIIAAAEKLVSVSVATRGQSDGYRQTEVLSASHRDVWEAFATFAPFAYDASVWGIDGRVILSATDEGGSCVVIADPAVLARLRGLNIELQPLT